MPAHATGLAVLDSTRCLLQVVGAEQLHVVQMGLHVFFGCYHNLFRLMAKCNALDNLLLKEHTHTFVNEGASQACCLLPYCPGCTKHSA